MRPARLLLAGLVGVALQFATGVAGAPPASAAACGPAPAGKVAVMVVIDVGEAAGAPWQRCVVVPEDSTGLKALEATGVRLRVGAGGFVCEIGGTPATGCATDDPSLPGWYYWHASPGGSWTYSQVGGGGYRLPKRCAVEGWSFGPPSPKRPPRVAPPSVTCEAPAPTPTAPPATTPVGGGGTASAAGGSSGDAVTGGGTSGGGGAPRAEQPSEASTSTTVSGEDSPSDPEQPGSDGAPDASTEQEVEDATADGERATARSEEPAQLEMADGPGSSGGGGSWVATAVVLLVVAAIGGGAVLRGRRR